MGRIRCCMGCVPPKRKPGCHGTCREYIEEKAALDEEKRAERKQRIETALSNRIRRNGIQRMSHKRALP